MGFSPGEFYDLVSHTNIHWEQRHDRVVLWSHDEMHKLADLPLEEAKKAFSQLRTILWTMTGEDPA
jgi:hypothetical protein